MTTLASWYHCSVKPVGRSAGRSIVAAAAYRLGDRLEDKEQGIVHDYRRRGGVEVSFTLAPGDAPGWASDPERLWNAAEVAEKRKNSRVGRECEVALPACLDSAAREQISVEIARSLINRYGVAVSVGIHRAPRDNDNEHAHFLMTSRVVGPSGLAEKTRTLDDKKTGPDEVKWIRATVADIINRALEDGASDQRITHLSFEARGIEREPTTHLGPSTSEMERREPGSTDRGTRNRDIAQGNRTVDGLVAELAAIDAEIAAAQEQRLDERYGPADPAPATPREAMAQAFETAIRPAKQEAQQPKPDFYRDAPAKPSDPARRDKSPSPIDPGLSPAERMTATFDLAIRFAVQRVEARGEAWLGARLWQQTMSVLERGAALLATVARDGFAGWRDFFRDESSGTTKERQRDAVSRAGDLER